eukprot:SAG11_NODE_9148_length_938_cov_1.212157_3_plen_59_part_01
MGTCGINYHKVTSGTHLDIPAPNLGSGNTCFVRARHIARLLLDLIPSNLLKLVYACSSS